jgi:hypothetical protein
LKNQIDPNCHVYLSGIVSNKLTFSVLISFHFLVPMPTFPLAIAPKFPLYQVSICLTPLIKSTPLPQDATMTQTVETTILDEQF